MSLQRNAPQNQPKQESNIEYQNIPKGEQEGRLAYVADLGFHAREFMGEFKGNFQNLALGIEMLGHTVTIDGKEKPVVLWTKPFGIYEDMFENSNEFKYYSVFEPTAKDKDTPNWDAQLGKPCNVVVQHTPGKGANAGRVFDNIASLQAIPSKYHSSVPAGGIQPESGMNDTIKASLYGLTKWAYDNQLQQQDVVDTAEPEPAFDDDIPF